LTSPIPLFRITIVGPLPWGSGGHAKSKNPVNNHPYSYHHYICSSYANEVSGSTCARHPIDAALVLRWLTQKLQEVYLGPGRDALVQEVRKQLKAEPKANKCDTKRLEKRLNDLEKEVGRLVRAIRTLDADELVEELALVQAERERIKAELAQAGKLTDAADLDAEAERIADHLWAIGERLGDSDPAVLRDVLRQYVYHIECRWETTRHQKQSRSRLVGGTVELWPQTPFSHAASVLGVVAQACSVTFPAKRRRVHFPPFQLFLLVSLCRRYPFPAFPGAFPMREEDASATRREFLKTTGRIAAATALAGAAIPRVHAAEDNTIRLALSGCGGRGTGAAADALSVNQGPVQLVALADVFPDRLVASYTNLKNGFPDRFDVPEDR